MNKKNTELITSKEYYLVKSSLTGMPYLDEERRAYLFSNMDVAKPFLATHENIVFEDKKRYFPNEICEKLYQCGALYIIVWDVDIEEIPIDTKIIKNKYYNPDFSYYLLMLKQTQEKQYLKKFTNADFIVPVYIDERAKKQFASIHYAYASVPGKHEKYYVVFSDLDEFKTWNNKMNNKYSPLKVKIRSLNNIRKKNPIIINPFGNKVILAHDLIKKIPVREE